MSIDMFLEADAALTLTLLEQALGLAGAEGISTTAHGLQAWFRSGLGVSADDDDPDARIYAENRHGLDFSVALRASLRIKGTEPEGESMLLDLQRIAQAITDTSAAQFLITLHYESGWCWRDAAGLHLDEPG